MVPLQEDLYISIKEVGIMQNLQCPGQACMREKNDLWRGILDTKYDFSSACTYKRVPFCPPGQTVKSDGLDCLPSTGGASIP